MTNVEAVRALDETSRRMTSNQHPKTLLFRRLRSLAPE
jgi:hypothetical protein